VFASRIASPSKVSLLTFRAFIFRLFPDYLLLTLFDLT